MSDHKDLILRTNTNLTAAELDELERRGFRVIGSLEKHCYRLRGTPAGAAEDLDALAFVESTGEFPKEAKITPALANQMTVAAAATAEAAEPVRILVSLDKDLSGETVAELGQIGKVVGSSERRALMEIDGARVGEVARLDGVVQIEEEPENTTQNNVARGLTQVEPIGTTLGLDGSGEIVGVADSGLDNGDAATILADFAGRVVNLRATVNKAAFGVNDEADLNNHGTHVSGSILSDGANSNGNLRGMAPAAQLTLLSMGPDNSTGLSVPFDLQAGVFQDAYDDGARLHNNSWGSNTQGNYSARSGDVDEFMRDNRDMLILIAAGNAGPNASTVNPPGTAKNCLTVGAAESVRPLPATITLNSNPQDHDFDPATPPVNVPLQAANWDQQADDVDDIAAFSGRGPTDDGRIAPDIVAPGSWILSCRSSVSTADVGPDGLNHAALGNPPLYADDADGVATHAEAVGRGLPGAPFFGTFDQNTPAAPAGSGANAQQNYFYDSGTSMATPITTGAASLLRQYLRERRGLASPSGALMKAMLVNGATVPAGQSNDPDNNRGFGWLDLQNTIEPQPTGQQSYSDDIDLAVATGDVRELQIQVADPALPLRVTMAYNDADGAGIQNKLYLRLVEPDGVTTHDGDTTAFPTVSNNLQRIHVAAPAPGVWTIEVHGIEVLNGIDAFLPGAVRQDFALAVINGVGFSPEPVDVVQVIDKSGSMGSYGYMDPAKERASQLVDLLRINDRTGAVAFNGAATPVHGVVPIAGFATQSAVQTAIGGVGAGGVTSMGAGLELALTELAAGGDPTHPQALVLLSDGHENTPPWIGGGATDSPPAWYGGPNVTEILPTVPAGTKVYTVSLGVQSDQVLLQDIATITGGVFHAIHSPAEIGLLHEIYAHLQALTGGEEVIAAGSDAVFGSGLGGGTSSAIGGIAPSDALASDLAASLRTVDGQDLSEDFLNRIRLSNVHAVPVDDTVDEVTFVVSWHEIRRGVTFRAVSPSGRVYNFSTAHEAHRGSSWEYLRIRTPEPGEWKLMVKAVARRAAWWAEHAYTWSCCAETPLGLRLKVADKRVGVESIALAAGLEGEQEHVRSHRISALAAVPTVSLDGLIERHASALRDIDLDFKPDNAKLDPALYKLAFLDMMLRRRGETIFKVRPRRIDLTSGNGFAGKIPAPVAGLYQTDVAVNGKTRAGHAFRRVARFSVRT